MRIKIIFLTFTLLCGGCVGPLVNHETARTLGRSNVELSGGYGMAGLLLKANFGIFEDLDFGIHYESLSIGVRAKYAWINSQEQGWSVSTAAGVGRGGYSTHYYGDLMAGHLKRPWEPYGTLRIVHVKTDPVELEDESNGDHFFHFETIDSVSFTYGQLILGARYWTQPQYFLSGEISTLAAFDSDVTIGNGFILSGALGRRF